MSSYRYYYESKWLIGEFLSYQQARKKLKRLGITSMDKLKEYRKNNLLSVIDIPRTPHQVYKKQWKNYWEFFGREKPNWISYEESQKIMQVLKIKTQKQFLKMKNKNHKLLKNIPRSPQVVYKKNLFCSSDTHKTILTAHTNIRNNRSRYES